MVAWLVKCVCRAGYGGTWAGQKIWEGQTCQADSEFQQPQAAGDWEGGQMPYARRMRQRIHKAIWDHYLGEGWRQALEAETDADSQRP